MQTGRISTVGSAFSLGFGSFADSIFWSCTFFQRIGGQKLLMVLVNFCRVIFKYLQEIDVRLSNSA